MTNIDQQLEDIRRTGLQHDCPFCGAGIGEPCRSRTSGEAKDWLHSRRIALTHPPAERRQPTYQDALCCVCGQQRTVNGNHYGRPNTDPNNHWSAQGKAAGWQDTKSLKCAECGEQTRHAVLDAKDRYSPNYDEKVQRYILGGEWEGKYPPDRDSMRKEYFAQFPRNPSLHHRFYVEEATKAFDEGQKMVTALCGAPETITTDPRLWGKYTSKAKKRQQEKYGEFVVAEQVSDIEYTDVDTGLEWLDIDCVDCCRVSNDRKRKDQRRGLELFLMQFATSPELVPDGAVGELLQTLQKWYEQSKVEPTKDS